MATGKPTPITSMSYIDHGRILTLPQGDADVVFSLANAQEEIKLFKNSVDAKVVPFSGGVHFLRWTHEQKVHQEILDFIYKWKGKGSGKCSL